MNAKRNRAKTRSPSSGKEFARPIRQESTPAPQVEIEKTVSELPSPEETLSLIRQLQELRQSCVLAFVTSPDVAVRGDVIEQIYEQLTNIGRVSQIDLFLHSAGGQTEIPWRLITLIRDFCDRFGVLIPSIAHSAATHIAMGADEIVMGPLSELGPVDPARSHPLLPRLKEGDPPITVSVQDLRHCVEFIKKELGNGASPESLAQILAALFEHIHPLAVGAIQQSYELSRLISRKALATHMNPQADKERIDQIVDAFSDEFFSHQYRIGWKEAKATGLAVTYASDDLWNVMWALYKTYRAYFALLRELPDNLAARPIVWIDSLHERRILEEKFGLAQDQSGRSQSVGPKVSQWLVQTWMSNG